MVSYHFCWWTVAECWLHMNLFLTHPSNEMAYSLSREIEMPPQDVLSNKRQATELCAMCSPKDTRLFADLHLLDTEGQGKASKAYLEAGRGLRAG